MTGLTVNLTPFQHDTHHMFSLSFTINLAVGDSDEQFAAFTTLEVCFL